ncbi:FAD-binding domain-containing protein [Xylaria telfairii]|nr:FAD-binding domain-containing protein [Xylaria telfairii]
MLLLADVNFTNTNFQCRTIPGDSSWPVDSIWIELNGTLNGRLIATVPIAAPCHKSVSGEPNTLFDEDECATLRDNWFFPETHLLSSSSPMGYSFSGNSCNPFLDSITPCTLGSHPVYTINATSALDFQVAVRFVTKHNIRLVVRNTGHDYLGKSTGAHSLSVWTRKQYTGPGIKMGAGVESMEAYKFAVSHGLVVVGGNCHTVGFAGGFTQGGGHGPLASKYGLSADQVLEWEVVTGTGELLTATATQNSDLFWALRGGGGGTFGIVSSLTVKAFPDTHTPMATMMMLNNGTNEDIIYSAVATFIRGTLTSLVDAGAFVVWIAAPFGFMITPAIAPGLALSDLDTLLQPFIGRLNDMGLEHQYSSTKYSTFLSSYEALQLIMSWNVSDYNVGGQLIPRNLATQNTEALVEAIRYISSQTLMSGVSYNLKSGVSSPDDVAVNPYIRETLFSLTLGTQINYTDWVATKSAQDLITYDLIPSLERLTPAGAAYLNEADFQQLDFQKAIYGDHYIRLRDIKRKYDPKDLFYAKTAGRLCRSTV